jgi:hypothetical protein
VSLPQVSRRGKRSEPQRGSVGSVRGHKLNRKVGRTFFLQRKRPSPTRRYRVTVLTVLLLAVINLAALNIFCQASTSSQLDKLRAEGYQALYNLDYETARGHFRQMIEIAPDHPAGPQCLAASLWIQQLNESWELKATLYSSDSYAKGKATNNEKLTKEFREWTRRAKNLSEARLRRDPNDVEALYFLGAAEGLEAAFAAAVERRFMAAMRTASKSVDHHRAALKLSPDLIDAQLTLGLHNYIVGALPFPLRMMVKTLGISGSKKRGLKTLEEVSLKGHWAQDVARVLLVDLYKREKRWSDAVVVARHLADKYPRNHLFKLQLADALTFQIKDGYADGLPALDQVYRSLLAEHKSDAETMRLIHFRFGESLKIVGKTAETQRTRRISSK